MATPLESTRGFLVVCLGALALGVLTYFAWPWAEEPVPTSGAPQLVLLLSIDTLRADRVGPQGDGSSATPQLDKLATVSHSFTQARSPIPFTLPAHASMLTGRYPVHHGIHDNGQVLADATTLPERLQAAGWQTAGFVAARVLHRRFGIARGFQAYDDGWVSGSSMEGVVQRGCEEVNASVKRWLQASADGPRFLFVHYFEPHRDYAPPSPFAERFEGDPYRGEVAYADHCAGALLWALAKRNLLNDALVIVTADHGEGLGDHDEVTHGLLTYESTQHVPLLIKGPGSTEASVDDRFVSLVDITPTVLAAAGLELGEPMDGIDLLSDVRGGPRTLWAESGQALEWVATPAAVAYRDPLKYIHGAHPELYDVRADSQETRNLFDLRAQDAEVLAAALRESGVVAAMSVQADGALDTQTREMLLALGYVRAEEGAVAPAEPLDAKDIAQPYYMYAGLRGTVVYQGKLAPKERDLPLIRSVEREASRLHEELPGVQMLATLAADARRLLAASSRSKSPSKGNASF
jgi:arylsulfatase A-like enzyme